MARRHDEDSGEYRKPARQPGNSVALWLLVAIGGGILLLCTGVTAFGLYVVYSTRKAFQEELADISTTAATGEKRNELRPSGPKPEKKKYTRDEFRKLVMGKSKAAVILAVGPPDSTQENGGSVLWYYESRTYDPLTGRTDFTQVCFDKSGFVNEINF